MVNAKLDALNKKLERMDMKVVKIALHCEICRERHANIDCSMLNPFPNEQNMEQANTVNFN